VADLVMNAEPAPVLPDDAELARELLNDLGNSRRLLARYRHDLRYVEELGFLAWDGRRWDRERGARIAAQCAHKTAEKIFDEAAVVAAAVADEKAALEKVDAKARTPEQQKRLDEIGRSTGAVYGWANKSCSRERTAAMLEMARPYLTADIGDFDQADMVLAVENCTLLIEPDASVRPVWHRRSDCNTRLAAATYDPEATCPRWRQQIVETLPDRETALYFQKTLGYSVCGDISHQFVTFLEGQGSNGKSTILEVVCEILADYAATTGIETFLHDARRGGSGPSPDIARLPGVRLVRTSEPEAGVRLSESRIKLWTGGEKMTARKLNRDFFEFRPRGKLIVSVNVKPTIVGKDFGIRRRIRVIPFRRQFGVGGAVKRNQATLVRELLAERSGILNWLLDGLRMVLEDGLDPPAEVEAATAKYFTDMDPIGQFFAEACERADLRPVEGGRQVVLPEVNGRRLYKAYERWCEASGETAKSMTAFGRRCTDLGFEKRASNGQVYRTGLRLLPEWDQDTKGSGEMSEADYRRAKDGDDGWGD
jgi:putative DNA primase/helicase